MQHPAFKIALRSLLRESSTYMFLAFVAGIMCLFIVLDGVRRSQTANIFAKDDRMLVVSNAIAPRYMLPYRYVDDIKRSPWVSGVESLAGVNFVPARLSGTRQSIPAMAAEPADLLSTNIDLVVWKEMAQRWIEDRNGVLVGRDLANQLGLKIGDSMSIESPAFKAAGGPPEMRLRVRAIYDVRDRAYPAYGVVLHYSLIRPKVPDASQGVNSIMILLRDRNSAQMNSIMIDSLFRHNPVPTRTALREQFVEAFNNQGAGMTQLISLYGIAGILAAALLLCTFCYYSARQLEGSYRLLKELGFQGGTVLARFAATIAALVTIGAATGIVVTLIGTGLFEVAIEQAFPLFSGSPKTGLLLLPAAALVALLISAVAFAVVARRPMSNAQPGVA